MIATVGVYARISVDRTGRREGVEAQERWGRDYATQTWPGYPIRVFADNNVSAAGNDERPGFQALRAAIRAGEITHLWCVEQSRLERREVQWFELAAELDAAGITELHTNRDGIVRVRDELAGIKAVLNAGEVRKLKRRVNDRLDEIAAQGRPGGGLTFGYRRGKDATGGNILEVVPEQAAALRWAADAVLAGWTLTNVAAELKRRGHTGARGGAMTRTTIRSMLLSPTVAGLRVHRGGVVGKALWEPIIAEETFHAVGRKLSEPGVVIRSDGRAHPVRNRRMGKQPSRKYALTGGLTRCGVCGTPLVGIVKVLSPQTRARYLLCSPARGGKACVGIMMDPTENHVLDSLFAELNQPTFLAAIATDEHADRRDELAEALTSIERQRNELAGLWADGRMSTSEWQTARNGLDQREQSLHGDLAAIPPPLVGIDITNARQAWPQMTLDEQRAFLQLFIEKITLYRAGPGVRRFDPTRIEITWRTV